jgi:hypothetical protein
MRCSATPQVGGFYPAKSMMQKGVHYLAAPDKAWRTKQIGWSASTVLPISVLAHAEQSLAVAN